MLAKIIATFFGSGLAPKAPGTFGSLAALIIGVALEYYRGTIILAASAAICLIIGTWATHVYIKATNQEDPKEVVIDEVVGMWLTLLIFPNTYAGIAIAFISFRFFDIIKPWPVSYFDKKVKNAFGVMMDDVVAGLYPAIIIYIIMFIAPTMGLNFNIMEWLYAL